jgi:TolB protein
VNSSDDEISPCISSDGLSLYFNSRRPGGFGHNDLYVTTRVTVEDEWGPPANLGPTVNAPSNDNRPYISADGLWLFFVSNNRPGGFGRNDIWVTGRETKNDDWGTPVNLGPPVNSPYSEVDLRISADGSTFYFASDRSGGRGNFGMWQVSIEPVVDLMGASEATERAIARTEDRISLPPKQTVQFKVPTLLSPVEGAELDNGRTDQLDTIVWDFDWSDVAGSTEYHLYVKGKGARNPVVNRQGLTHSSYHHVRTRSYVTNRYRFGWTWKVRAKTGVQWGEWSPTRSFYVESANTDPPSLTEARLRIPEQMQACAANLQKIHSAIKKYEDDRGRLPDWLSDLVPDYLSNGVLFCPSDAEHVALYSPDPKLPCSYSWQFSAKPIPTGWDPTGRTLYRDWKAQQVELFGDVVPMVRCSHHGGPYLNLSVGGQIWWGQRDWEYMFKPDYRFGDESPKRQRSRIQPAGQLRIAGVARDEAGKPLARARLRVLPMSRREVTSDSQGRFEIAWDPRRSGSRQRVHYLVARHERRNLAVAVEIDEETKTLDLKLKPGVTLTGKVVDPDGKGIGNARIMTMLRVSNWGSSLGQNQVQTDAEGKFEVKAIPAQHKYGVYARADGYGEKNVEVRADDAVGSRLELRPIILALANLSSVSGVVVDVNDKPVPEARISAYGEGQPRRSTQTDAEGKFTIEKICDGQIRITARVSGKTPSYGYVETAGQATDVKIVLKEPSISRYSPGQQRVKVTGVVRDEVGKPVDGAGIRILPYGRQVLSTDAEGKFEVSWQPRRLGGSQREHYLVARHRQRNLAAAVEIDRDTKHLDIKLTPGVILAGKVVDVEGKGIPSADISLIFRTSNIGYGVREVTKIDAEGNYEIRAVPSGYSYRYSVSASAEGYGRQSVRIDTVEAIDDRMELEPLGLAIADLSVSGVVVDVNDQPVAGASVHCSGEGQPYQRAHTNADGKFTLEKICAGRIRVTASILGETHLSGYTETEGGATDVKIVATERYSYARYVPKQPPSLVREPLPELKDLAIELSADADDEMILMCFWDIEQRPSRYCMRELTRRAEELKGKGVTVVAVQASKVDEDALNEWAKENNIPFPVGMIQGNVEKVRFAWGVKLLPWLILTDRNHIIRAEGFGLAELRERIRTSTPHDQASIQGDIDHVRSRISKSADVKTKDDEDLTALHLDARQGKIAFISLRDGNPEIYVMNADGSQQKNLTNNPAYDDHPSWSPDGTKIAFTASRDGNGNLDICVMNADGSEQKNLTNDPAYDDHPFWSPDGKRIAFRSFRDGNREIHVMNADGSERKRLTKDPAEDAIPSWSPDGKRIAFHSFRDRRYEIYVMNADGSEQKRLTKDPGYKKFPSWLPDGKKIAFVSLREIQVMNADGSEQKRLTKDLGINIFPSCSPDGQKIAFVSDKGGTNRIYVVNADGRDTRRLTHSDIGRSKSGFPSWSPDGTKIAFTSSRDGNGYPEIYVMNADGSEQKNLTNNPAYDGEPSWSPFLENRTIEKK